MTSNRAEKYRFLPTSKIKKLLQILFEEENMLFNTNFENLYEPWPFNEKI